MTSDHCQNQTPIGQGVYWCVSTQFPTPPIGSVIACSTSCADQTITDHFVHIRFLPGPTDSPWNCADFYIYKVEITITKDAGSDQFGACRPITQWGLAPWTNEWSVTDQFLGSISTESCYSWGFQTSRTLTFDPPNSSYWVHDPNHWMVNIRGASGYTIKLYYSSTQGCDIDPAPGNQSVSTYQFTPTITNNACPVSCN